MHTFLKEAKRKQKRVTFARIHRLTCQRNTLPCAPSILKHHVSAEVCLLGQQWILSGFTLRKVQHHQSICAKPKDSLDIDYPRNEGRLANRFFPRNVCWMFLWDPTVKRQYPKSPPAPLPPQKNRFLFGLGRPIRNMLSIFQYDRSTTLSNRIGLFLKLYRVQQRHAKFKPTTNYQLQKSIFFSGQRNITGQNALFPNVCRTFLRKKSICSVSSLNNIKARKTHGAEEHQS